MKNTVLLILFLFSISIYSQDVQVIKPAEGKSMVYFTRTSSGGILINFSFYDGEEFIGKLKPGKFIAYECDPGHHIFIGKCENTDYVEANLEEGKIYVIDSQANIGIMKSRIKLVPLDRNSKKYEKDRKKFLKLISKKKGEIVSIEDEAIDSIEDKEDMEDYSLGKTVRKFYEKKKKNQKITQLTADMFIDTEV